MDNTTNGKGARTEVTVMSALLRAGKTVLMPVGVQRYDLVFEDEGGFHRVQCKTGRLSRAGVIKFNTCSMHSRTRQRVSYRGDADFFGVNVPGNANCFLVPVELTGEREGTLRVDSPKNGQVHGILYARDFLIPDKVGEAIWADGGP
jgi:hypothetical protein